MKEFEQGLSCVSGRAVAQAVSGWLPNTVARVRVHVGMWCLWWTKRQWGRFSPSTSVSPANNYSNNFFIIIITRSWHNWPIGDRSVEWTQLDSTPNIPIKKYYISIELILILTLEGL
jgi:hypothetical protein